MLLRVVAYAFGTILISNLLVFGLAAILYFPDKVARHLYQTLQRDPGLSLLKEWYVYNIILKYLLI